jgi:hypothetical protein
MSGVPILSVSVCVSVSVSVCVCMHVWTRVYVRA